MSSTFISNISDLVYI